MGVTNHASWLILNARNVALSTRVCLPSIGKGTIIFGEKGESEFVDLEKFFIRLPFDI
jgi:hypothetical protein